MHKLGSYANLDIAHQLDYTFSTKYAYAGTHGHGSFSAGEVKKNIHNTFKEATGLP